MWPLMAMKHHNVPSFAKTDKFGKDVKVCIGKTAY